MMGYPVFRNARGVRNALAMFIVTAIMARTTVLADYGQATFLGTVAFMGMEPTGEDHARSLTFDRGGNLIVTGTVTTKRGLSAQIRIYDANLQRLISERSCGSWESITQAVVNTSDDVIVAGTAALTHKSKEPSEYWAIRKYDHTLKRLISSTSFITPIGKQSDMHCMVQIAVNSKGEVLVAGTEKATDGKSSWRIIKYNQGLTAIVSNTTYQSAHGDCQLNALAVDDLDNVLLAGEEAVSPDTDETQMVVVKLSPSLSRIESSTVYMNGEGSENTAHGVRGDESGGVMVLGTMWPHASGKSDYIWTIRRYNASLNVLLSSTEYAGKDSIGLAIDMAVADGSVYVLGRRRGRWMARRMDIDFRNTTATMSRDEGAKKRLSASHIAVDHAGNMYVLGDDNGGPKGGTRWRIWKYGLER
jgi:hypothetical protein